MPARKRLHVLRRELTTGILQLLYPNMCAICRTPLPAAQPPFCSSCHLALTTDPRPSCPHCAATVGPHAAVEAGCVHCRERSLHFTAALRLGPYEGVLRDVVLRLKHVSGEGLAELMGELWAEQAAARFATVRADLVVPVPLHWWRRWQRGYNQSEALARTLAARLKIPCFPRYLRRIRHTPPQTAQAASARPDNVRGAFWARPRPGLAGKNVLLVDDVMTTGSTCAEAARALLASGAGRVTVVVLARAES